MRDSFLQTRLGAGNNDAPGSLRFDGGDAGSFFKRVGIEKKPRPGQSLQQLTLIHTAFQGNAWLLRGIVDSAVCFLILIRSPTVNLHAAENIECSRRNSTAD